MKYSTMVLSMVAVIVSGTVYAQNGGMEGPPDMAKATSAPVPHAPAKPTGRPKVVQPQH